MKMLIAVAAMTLMCGSAFAQNTGPQPQTDNMQKPGMNNSPMDKGSMNKGDNTTGMNRDSTKDQSKDGSPNAMKKGDMKK